MNVLQKVRMDTEQNHALWIAQGLISFYLDKKSLSFKELVATHSHDLYHCCYLSVCHLCKRNHGLPPRRIPLKRKHLLDLSIIDKNGKFITDDPSIITIPPDKIDIDIALAMVYTCDEIFWYFCTEYRNKNLYELVNEHKSEITKLFQELSTHPINQDSDETGVEGSQLWTSCSFCSIPLSDTSTCKKTDRQASYLRKLCKSRNVSCRQISKDNKFLSKDLLQIFSKLRVHLVNLLELGKDALDSLTVKEKIASIEKTKSALLLHLPHEMKPLNMEDNSKRSKTKQSRSKIRNIPPPSKSASFISMATILVHILPKESNIYKSKYWSDKDSRKVIPPTNQDLPRCSYERTTSKITAKTGENNMTAEMTEPIRDPIEITSFTQEGFATFQDFILYTGNVLFRTPQARLASFRDWPFNSKFWPSALADAGFFYTGKDNIVQCFSCDFTDSVRNWEPTNTAMLLHAGSSPECDYVISMGFQKPIKKEMNNNALGCRNLENFTEAINRSSQYQINDVKKEMSFNVIDFSQKPNAILFNDDENDSYHTENDVADHLDTTSTQSKRTNDYSFPKGSQITIDKAGNADSRTARHTPEADSDVYSPDFLPMDLLNLGTSHCSTIMTSNAFEPDVTTDAMNALLMNETANMHEARIETDAGLWKADNTAGRIHPDYTANISVPERSCDKPVGYAVSQTFDASLFEDNTVIFRYPEYQLYSSRICSFIGWTFSSIKPEVLSSAGYFYTGEADIVRCFCCDLGLAEWNNDDDAWLEHARHSSDCWFLVTEKGEDYVRGVQNEWRKVYNPKHPGFQNKELRLNTFCDVWRSDIEQTPEILVDAGFFYTGKEDIVRCHYCDGGLRNWEVGDVPWEEHARWFPFCKFVLKIKGKEYVDAIRMKYETNEHRNQENSASTGMVDFRNSEATQNNTSNGQFENDPSKLKEINRQLKEQFLCHRCKTHECNIVFRPCGHRVVCEDCSDKIDRCIICNVRIKSRIKTYLA